MKALILLSLLFCSQVFAQRYSAQINARPGTNLPDARTGFLAPVKSGSAVVSYYYGYSPTVSIETPRRNFYLQFEEYASIDISYSRYPNYQNVYTTMDGQFDMTVNLQERMSGETYNLVGTGQICRVECVAIVQEECAPSDRDRYGNCPAINPTPDRPHCINQQVCRPGNQVCYATSQISKQVIIDIVNRYAPAQAVRLVSQSQVTSGDQRPVPRNYCR